jgi:hypothetical protein
MGWLESQAWFVRATEARKPARSESRGTVRRLMLEESPETIPLEKARKLWMYRKWRDYNMLRDNPCAHFGLPLSDLAGLWLTLSRE